MRKKAIAVILALLLAASMTACSGDNNEKTDLDENTKTEDTNLADEENGEETPEKIYPNAVSDQDEEKADFGIEVKKSFKMSGTLKKISYKDISGSGETLEKRLESALSKSDIGDFVMAFNEYEDDDSDGIDKLTYVVAIEEDDMDKATIEAGVYHSTKDNKYYQYNGYTSETLTKADAPIKSILTKIESAYGIKLSQTKVEAALKKAWQDAQNREDYYGLYQTAEYKGDGYTDLITVRTDVGYDEEDNMSAYIYVER